MSNSSDMKPNMKNRMPYDTPEGFFDDMQKKLLAIPQREDGLLSRRDSLTGRILRGRPVFSWRVAGTTIGALAVAALAVFVLLRQPSDGGLDACAEDVLAATMQSEQIEEYLADSGISVYQLTDYLD